MKLTVRYLCAPGQRLSGQHATSRDSPRLVFLFKSLGCSREQIEAQHRAGAGDRNTPDRVAKEPFEGIMCTYVAQIPQDWIGDLGCSCFLLVVQRKRRNDSNYCPSNTSLGRAAQCGTHR